LLIALAAAPLSWAGEAASSAPGETIRSIVYAHPGDYALHADIYRPTGPGPFPAVLCVHGGAWALGNRYQMAPIAQRLASHGYAAVTIDYRHAPQFLFPAQLDDCRAALDWMLANDQTYKLDRRRFAAWGYSAGAHLVALLAFQAKPLPPGAKGPLRAVIAGGTPVDFRQFPIDSRSLDYWLGGSRREKPQLYEAASPARFATAAAPPVFFYHGESDDLVPIAPVKSLKNQLDAWHVPTAMYVVPGAGHIRAFFDSTAMDRATAFLDKWTGK
jgi:acetyl esterase/lipase